MIRFVVRIIFPAMAIAAIGIAQAPKGGAPAPGGTSAPTTLPTSRTTNNGTNPVDQALGQTQFISGKVVLEDGTPPPDAALIERVCGPTRRAEARTDSKGQFSFQIGGATTNTEQILDASSGAGSRLPGMSLPSTTTLGTNSPMNPRGQTDLRNCELRAVLAGYRSTVVNLATQFKFDNPDIGIIVLKRLGKVDGTTLSVNSALAPKDARRAYDKGRQWMTKGEVADARVEFSKAVEIYPKYAMAWSELGMIEMDLKESVEAKQSFEKSIAADPSYLPPYERLAVLALRKHEWPELVAITTKIIQLSAYEYPQAYYYNALANLNINQADAAEKSARQALKQDPEKFVRAYYILGLALAQRGDFAAATENLKTYVAAVPTLPELDLVKKQLAEIERRASVQQPQD